VGDAGLDGRVISEEKTIVNDAGEDAAEERTDPVNAVV
jgi:hypothetical protein